MTKVGEYYLGPSIGEGSFASVKYGVNYRTGDRVACKILSIKNLTAKQIKNVKCEVELCNKLKNHTNIVELKYCTETPTTIYLFFELCVGGDLHETMTEGPIKEHRAQNYFQDIIQGLTWIHSQGVVHRDLKPENCLIDEDGHIKLSDFGLATIVKKDPNGTEKHLTDFCGTHHYASPEIIHRVPYLGTLADIWACGVILFGMVAGRLPFYDSNPVELSRKIQNCEFNFPKNFSRYLKDLVSMMLVEIPNKRCSLSQISQSRWFPKKNIILDTSLGQPHNQQSEKQKNEQMDKVQSTETEQSQQQQQQQQEQSIEPPQADAFDIIGWTGVFDISRILQKAVGPTKIKEKLKTQFIAEDDAASLFTNIQNSLAKIDTINYAVDTNSSKITITDELDLNGTIQLYTLASNLYLVDFVQKQGDSEAWWNTYRLVHSLFKNKQTK